MRQHEQQPKSDHLQRKAKFPPRKEELPRLCRSHASEPVQQRTDQVRVHRHFEEHDIHLPYRPKEVRVVSNKDTQQNSSKSPESHRHDRKRRRARGQALGGLGHWQQLANEDTGRKILRKTRNQSPNEVFPLSFNHNTKESLHCSASKPRFYMSDPQKPKIILRPRIRILLGGEIVMGPGKAELLAHIVETRSLSESAKRMKMSYMKAWLLVQTMNRSYNKPLVQAERGGRAGGGARLTAHGRRVLSSYREMEVLSLAAIQGPWKKLRRMLKRSSPS